jgi:hypothetical protein
MRGKINQPKMQKRRKVINVRISMSKLFNKIPALFLWTHREEGEESSIAEGGLQRGKAKPELRGLLGGEKLKQ